MNTAMKVVAGVGGVVVVGILGLVGLVAMQPSTVHIERTHVVAATPADVWPYVSDMHGFVKWSPWEGRDPNQVKEFSDPASGVGAWYGWKGNDDVGSGKMTFTVVEPETKVVEDLEFFEPFAAKAQVDFTLTAVEGGTQVKWGYDGNNGMMAKAVSLVMDMDAMLGADFEKGLTSLAGLAEADAKARVERERVAAEEAAAAAAPAVAVP